MRWFGTGGALPPTTEQLEGMCSFWQRPEIRYHDSVIRDEQGQIVALGHPGGYSVKCAGASYRDIVIVGVVVVLVISTIVIFFAAKKRSRKK